MRHQTTANFSLSVSQAAVRALRKRSLCIEKDGKPFSNFDGDTLLRMTDFPIEPPAPKIALGTVKTGDEVKLSFEWMVGETSRPHSGATAETLPR